MNIYFFEASKKKILFKIFNNRKIKSSTYKMKIKRALADNDDDDDSDNANLTMNEIDMNRFSMCTLKF